MMHEEAATPASTMGNRLSKVSDTSSNNSEEKYSLRGTPSRAASRAEKTQKPFLDASISVNSYPNYKHAATTHLNIHCRDNVPSGGSGGVAFYGLAVEDCLQVGYQLDNPFVAVVGGNVATIHQYESGRLVHVQDIVDLDKEEVHYTCVWTRFREGGARCRSRYAGERVLIFGGKLGILNVYNVQRKVVLHRSTAHHGEINDLAVHPVYPHIVATASSDDSVHLYNVQEDLVQLANLEVPDMGSPVQSVCFNMPAGDRLISGDMAHQITIWRLDVSEVRALDIKAKMSVKAIKKQKQTFSECDYVKQYTVPEFLTCVAGTNYIDCIQVIGNELILSKNASTNCITIWHPKNLCTKAEESLYATSLREDKIHVVAELEVDTDLYWWDRFAHDPRNRYIVCGSEDGVVYLWDLCNLQGLSIPHVKFRVPTENRKGGKHCHIRQVAFSPNGKCLFALDSTNQSVHTFHLVENKQKTSNNK